MDGNADVGSYSYGSRPHAVTSAGGATYGYDANGNMTSGDGRTIGYGVFNKPTSITRGTRTVHLYYGPNRNRYRRVDDAGQSTETDTHYVGNVEWIFKPGNVVVTKRYLNGEAIETTTNTAGSIQRALHYLLKDHLGSTHLITDELGAIVQAQSFDAFGLRRHDDDYAALTLSQRLNFNTSFTTRGFTGHEGLEPVGLVHMNGRVYDPKLGRFVSGDPFVQDAANTQSHNRYSYVLNNPLSYTDPSGYFFKKVFKNKLFRTIASIATSAFLPVAGFMAAFSELGAAVASGFLAGLVATGGDLQGAVMGAFGAGLFYGIGSSGFLNSHRALKTAAHGLAGGTMEVLQGGKFGHGFASAFVTHTASGGIARIDAQNARFSPARVFASATLGGTISAATGGKFANGAITGAFSRAFNDEQSHREVRGREDLGELNDEQVRALSKDLKGAFDTLSSASADELIDMFPDQLGAYRNLDPIRRSLAVGIHQENLLRWLRQMRVGVLERSITTGMIDAVDEAFWIVVGVPRVSGRSIGDLRTVYTETRRNWPCRSNTLAASLVRPGLGAPQLYRSETVKCRDPLACLCYLYFWAVAESRYMSSDATWCYQLVSCCQSTASMGLATIGAMTS